MSNILEQQGGTQAVAPAVTVAEVGQTGLVDQVGQLQASLNATDQSNHETRSNLVQALIQTTSELTKAVQVLSTEKAKAADEDRYNDLNASRLVEMYKGLSEADKAVARRELSGDYGVHNVELVLTGNRMEKALRAPITERNPNFDQIQMLRNAFDKIALYATFIGGYEPDQAHSDQGKYNKQILLQAAKRLEKDGLEGADLVIKAINEALDTQTATEGLEWVPTAMSSRMLDDLYLDLRVASLFPRYNMPTKAFDMPIRLARTRGYRMPEATLYNQFFSVLATDHGMETGKITFTAEKLATLQFASDELEQDAILPIINMMYEEAVYGMADAIEDAVINGDTVTTSGHMDSTLWTGTADARGAWDGLRKLTESGDKASLATFNLTNLRNLRKLMGKYGAVTPENLTYIIAPETHIDFLNLSEVVTVDKYGSNATILTGEIGRIDGIPIIVSPRMYTNLNATGVWDGVTTTKTSVLLVNRRGFGFGDRRLVRVETDRAPLAGQRYVLSTWRGDFQKLFPSAESLVVQGYNITV